MFEKRGEVLRDGKLMRVTAKALNQWIDQHMVPATI